MNNKYKSLIIFLILLLSLIFIRINFKDNKFKTSNINNIKIDSIKELGKKLVFLAYPLKAQKIFIKCIKNGKYSCRFYESCVNFKSQKT